MSNKLSNEEFQRRAKELNNNLTVLGDYTTMKDPILVKCNDCGREMMSYPQVILKGGGCCKCRGKRITASKLRPFEELKERIEKINPNIEILYEENKSKEQSEDKKRWRTFRCKCRVCGNEWSKPKDYLIEGVGCPECYKNGKIIDDITFKEKMKILHPNIEILEEYKGYHEKIKLRCKIDNYEWETKPAKLFRTDMDKPSGCPLCGGRLQLTHNEFCARVKKYSPDIIICSQYKNNRSIIKCKCSCCGHEWETSANALMYEKYCCPNCKANRSKGEMAVYDYLKKNGIQFKEQFTFGDCKDKNPLPFDFYLINFNMCIEYDGSQHFMITPHFCDEENRNRTPVQALEYYVKHDQIKTNYCKEHNIKLLRIPYTEYKNINQILDDTFMNCQAVRK